MGSPADTIRKIWENKPTDQLRAKYIEVKYARGSEEFLTAVREILLERGEFTSDLDASIPPYAEEFWQATWSAWRSGVLSPISPTFAQIASGWYDDFVKTSADFKNPLISTFLATHPPLAGEFLISFGASGKQPGMIMTSQRLWMLDKQNGEFVSFNLSDVAQIKSSAGQNSSDVTIQFRDNKEQRFPKMASAPPDQVVAFAIERCAAPEGWKISAPTAQPLDGFRDQKVKAPQWEIQLQDGTVRKVFVASELFPEILSGAISGDLPCRDFPAPSKNGTTKNKKWSNVANKVGASGYEARLFFKPVWAHSLRGLQTGAILGLVFWLVMNIFNSLSAGIELRGLTDAKGHDLNTKFGAYAIACGYWLAQSIPVLAEVVPLAWIKNLGAFVAPRAFQAAAMCLFFLGMKSLDVLAVFAGLIPGMGAAFGALIAGSLAGGPPGMMIGTIIGWARRSRLQTAPGWPREKLYSLLLKGVLLPTSISAVAVLIYIKYLDSLIEEVTKRFLQ